MVSFDRKPMYRDWSDANVKACNAWIAVASWELAFKLALLASTALVLFPLVRALTRWL